MSHLSPRGAVHFKVSAGFRVAGSISFAKIADAGDCAL
jgi:hypothetical protein